MERRALCILILLSLVAPARAALGAVGCELNDPDRDVKRLFPGSTGYKTLYMSVAKKGGDPLLRRIESRLGDSFHGIYETADVPYTIYEIYQGKERVGYIHGVNHKGQYGGIQVFLALDLAGTIKSFYIQKLTSQHAKQLRAPEFGRQFVGLSLEDFSRYDVVAHRAEGRVAAVANPAPQAEIDFRAALRATKKNLILMDEFVLGGQP